MHEPYYYVLLSYCYHMVCYYIVGGNHIYLFFSAKTYISCKEGLLSFIACVSYQQLQVRWATKRRSSNFKVKIYTIFKKSAWQDGLFNKLCWDNTDHLGKRHWFSILFITKKEKKNSRWTENHECSRRTPECLKITLE